MRNALTALVALFIAATSHAAIPPVAPPTKFQTAGNPSSLVVWGGGTPLVVRPDGRVFAAAGRLGDGKVVAVGHDGYLDADHEPTQRFLRDSLRWLRAGMGSTRVAGLTQDQFDRLAFQGALFVPGSPADIDLSAADLIVGSPQTWASAGRLDELRAFIEAGNGLLATECAWGQIQLGRAESTSDLAANRLLEEAGIAYTDRAETGTNTHDSTKERLAHLDRALEEVIKGGEDAAFASRVATEAVRALPRSMLTTRRMLDKLTNQEARRETLAKYKAMADTPLTPADAPLANVMLEYEARLVRESISPPYAHPTFRVFPGEADPMTRRGVTNISIDPKRSAWHSTGLWVRAGESAQVSAAPGHEAAGLGLQIGSWLDPQDFDGKVRFPVAVTAATIAGTHAGGLSSPIGGPLYVVVPVGYSGSLPIELRVIGAVPMPHFVLGETTLDQWKAMRESPSAPWVELESDELVFTLPMERVAQCERPDLVMEHWDRVHAAMHRLNPRSPRHWPDGKYRYVAEKRLSWGYMYCPADAPIVIPMTAADEMVDLTEFDAEGPHQLWGHYHEMGHAHQDPAWTFDGTGEVTVNIFTVYALHTVNGYPLDSEHVRTSPTVAQRRFEQHKASGASFDAWKRDPFLALQTYAMLWHAFGFEAFGETFARYRDGRVPRPTSDADKRDTFVRTFSSVVERDLSGYFEAWGVPISQQVRDDLAGLEPWMPTTPERAPE